MLTNQCREFWSLETCENRFSYAGSKYLRNTQEYHTRMSLFVLVFGLFVFFSYEGKVRKRCSRALLVSLSMHRLQSIYVTRDRVILKFEARVQIYKAVLNICCEIQNSDRNVVRFSKINSYGISFWLVLFKNMRNIRFLGVWCHYFAVNLRISEIFSEKS